MEQLKDGLGNDLRQYSYDGVADKRLQSRLETVEGTIQSETRWPLRMSQIRNNFFDALGLDIADVFRAYRYVLGNKTIALTTNRSGKSGMNISYYFNQDMARAFAALCLTADSVYGGKLKSDVVQKTRDALGMHNLASLLKPPTLRSDKSFPPQPKADIAGQQIKDEEVASETDKSRDGSVASDSAPAQKIESKFPVLNPVELKYLAGLNRWGIEGLFVRFPNEAQGDIDPIRHKVPNGVVKAVIFILRADVHILASYKPDEHYSIMEFRQGLQLCLRYFKRYPKVMSLGQLMIAVEEEVKKNPNLYLGAAEN